MATLTSSTLQFLKSYTNFLSPQQPCCHPLKPNVSPRATAEVDESSTSTSLDTEPNNDDIFENRLSQVRLSYNSGTTKKAEVHKARKGKKTGVVGSESCVFLPPVPLTEPVSEG